MKSLVYCCASGILALSLWVDDPKLEVKGFAICKIRTGWLAGRNSYNENQKEWKIRGTWTYVTLNKKKERIWHFSFKCSIIYYLCEKQHEKTDE